MTFGLISKLQVAMAVVLVASLFTVGKQTPEPGNKSRPVQKPAVKKEGWAIPASNHFQKPQAFERKVIDETEVLYQVVHHEEKDEPLVDVDGNEVKLESAREGQRLFAVRSVTAYSLDDRVFAYAALLVPVAIDNGARNYAGAMYQLYFYDEDADGVFETLSVCRAIVQTNPDPSAAD
jgi:hypothetical protein